MRIRLLCACVFITMALLLCSCGNVNSVDKETIGTKTTLDNTEVKEDDFQTIEAFNKTPNIDETILYEKNGLTITAKDIEYNNNEALLNISIENASIPNVSITAETMGYSVNAVNKYMVENGYMSCELEPGDKIDQSMRFSYEELVLNGITEIAEIQVGFAIKDGDDTSYTGPLSVRTDIYDKYDFDNTNYRRIINSDAIKYTYDVTMDYFAEDEIYSSNGISILSEALMTNSNGRRILNLEVKNGSKDNISFLMKDFAIDNVMIYDGLCHAEYITAGNKMIVACQIDNLIENSDQSIGEINLLTFLIESENDEGYAASKPDNIHIALTTRGEDLKGQEIISKANDDIVDSQNESDVESKKVEQSKPENNTKSKKNRTVEGYVEGSNEIDFHGVTFSMPEYFNQVSKSGMGEKAFCPKEEDYYATLGFDSEEMKEIEGNEWMLDLIFASYVDQMKEKASNVLTKRFPSNGATIYVVQYKTDGGEGATAYFYHDGRIIIVTMVFDDKDQSSYNYLADFENMLQGAKF